MPKGPTEQYSLLYPVTWWTKHNYVKSRGSHDGACEVYSLRLCDAVKQDYSSPTGGEVGNEKNEEERWGGSEEESENTDKVKSKGKVYCGRSHEGQERKQRYSSTLSLTSATDGGGWLTPRPGRFTPKKETRYPLYRWLGGPQNRYGRVRKISPSPGFDPGSSQPVESREEKKNLMRRRKRRLRRSRRRRMADKPASYLSVALLLLLFSEALCRRSKLGQIWKHRNTCGQKQAL